jgi:hypothetical protein
MPSLLRLAAPAFAGLLVLAACGGNGDDAAPDQATTTTAAPDPDDTDDTPPGPAPTVEPFERAEDAVDWFIDILDGAQVTAQEYDQRVSETFSQQVDHRQFTAPLGQLRDLGPYAVVDRVDTRLVTQVRIQDVAGTRWVASASIDGDGRIGSLWIQPDPGDPPGERPPTAAEALDGLAAAGDLRALTAEVVDGACVPIDARAADELAPLGSVFKLYVLAALAEEVAAGTIGWDDLLTIRDEHRSVPAGVLQDRPAGDQVTVRDATEVMIAVSDNTATDHLIALLGRQRVEDAFAQRGVPAEANTPLLTTRELTMLKVGPPERLQAYAQGDAVERRSIRDELADDELPGLAELTGWTEPRALDEVEWFASPAQLCDLSLHLAELAQLDGLEPVAAALGASQAFPLVVEHGDPMWFKGGSEPGLLAVWFRTEADGRTFAITGSVADDELDPASVTGLWLAAHELTVAEATASG